MGHREAWNYTPRQMDAFLFLARRRQKRDMRNQLFLMRDAFHAEKSDLQRRIKELEG